MTSQLRPGGERPRNQSGYEEFLPLHIVERIKDDPTSYSVSEALSFKEVSRRKDWATYRRGGARGGQGRQGQSGETGVGADLTKKDRRRPAPLLHPRWWRRSDSAPPAHRGIFPP